MRILRCRFQHDKDSKLRDTHVLRSQRFDSQNRPIDIFTFEDSGAELGQFPCKDNSPVRTLSEAQ